MLVEGFQVVYMCVCIEDTYHDRIIFCARGRSFADSDAILCDLPKKISLCRVGMPNYIKICDCMYLSIEGMEWVNVGMSARSF